MPSYGEATTLSRLLAFATTLIICIRMWKLIDWKHLWLILETFIVISSGAIYVLDISFHLALKRRVTKHFFNSFNYNLFPLFARDIIHCPIEGINSQNILDHAHLS